MTRYRCTARWTLIAMVVTTQAYQLYGHGCSLAIIDTAIAVTTMMLGALGDKAARRGGASINAAAKASGINYRTAQRIVEGAEHRQRQPAAVG